MNHWINEGNFNSVYDAFLYGEPFPAKCQVCGDQSAHIYYEKYSEQRAGCWCWCDRCKHYEHTSSRAYPSWTNLPAVEKLTLYHNPDALNEIKEEIDKHVNSISIDSILSTKADHEHRQL